MSLDQATKSISTNFKHSLDSIQQDFIEEFGKLVEGFPDFGNASVAFTESLKRINDLAVSMQETGERAVANLEVLGDAAKGMTELRVTIGDLAKDIEAFSGSSSVMKSAVDQMETDLSKAQEVNERLTELLIENATKVVKSLKQ